jgi:hypothetical protein
MRGDNGDEKDNKALVKKMTELRAERAAMLGYDNHAAFVLEEAMAANPDNVYSLINRLWSAAKPRFEKEAVEMKALATQDGITDDLKVHDWFYYAEKLRKERYDLDEEQIREYFSMDRVTEGLFDVVNKLWGVTLKERTDLPVYHEDVKVFEVFDRILLPCPIAEPDVISISVPTQSPGVILSVLSEIDWVVKAVIDPVKYVPTKLEIGDKAKSVPSVVGIIPCGVNFCTNLSLNTS